MESFLKKALKTDKIEILPLAGDASSRRYYRVVVDQDSWVLMAWEPFKDDDQYPFLSVRNHFAKHNVQVPNVVAKSPDEGLVLLEDLGDLTLERKFWENQNQDVALPFYKQALDELIKMHFPATFDRTNCVAFRVAFDVEKLLWEMNYGKDHLLLKMCQLQLSLTEQKSLDRIFTEICTILHQEPKFIAHRDYHSRNLMIKFGKMRVIDFQDARMGAVQYDLVSLLRDSYVDLSDDSAKTLIQYYLEKSEAYKAQGANFSRENFFRIYELQTIQRCFKACGSFSSFYNLREDTRYLKYLTKTLHTVEKSLVLFPEYREFLSILRDRGVLEKNYDSLVG